MLQQLTQILDSLSITGFFVDLPLPFSLSSLFIPLPLHSSSPIPLSLLTNMSDGRQQPSAGGKDLHPQKHKSETKLRLLFGLRAHRTPLVAWIIAVICTLLWLTIILGGLAILIIYLLFRPRSPRFDISSATLNAAYIDADSLINADLTILANISNPNKKIDVSFDYFGVDLFYGSTLIATTAVDSFSERRREARLGNFHFVSSQVQLQSKEVEQLRRELDNSSVSFEAKGSFKTRSHIGRNFLHFSYWLHSRCSIVVSGPPDGALLSSDCKTKR